MMASPTHFEVTLLSVSDAGDLIFDHKGSSEQLLACQGSIGKAPSTPATLAEWKAVVGARGTLKLAWHKTQANSALYSFEPYKDQTQRRVYQLDDLGVMPGLIGWRDYKNPAGYLAPTALAGRGV